MALLPEGFALPPLPFLVGLVLAALAVGVALYRTAPPVTEWTVLAVSPWMVTGSALYVLFQIGAVPAAVAPLFGSPAVYVTTFVVLGILWIGTARTVRQRGDRMGTAGRQAAVLATVGTVFALAIVAGALAVGIDRGTLVALWPAIGALVSVVLTGAVWTVLKRTDAGVAGWAGVLAVFAHVLDGVSTAIGIDVLGFGEQTPLARAVLDLGAALPVADLVGTGWLFIAVKTALAGLIVWLLAGTVRERPREGYLFCAFVAAVGLGPGSHNLLLFTVTG
jgi:uncharacterized membrane protein